MLNIGCNYIISDNCKNVYDDLYTFLVKNKLIDILKFPGKFCNDYEFESCLNLVRKLNIKIDLHGLPKMEPKTHSENMLKNIEWNKLPNDLFNFINKNRISTHIGAEKGQNIDDLNNIFFKNIKLLKEKFYSKYNKEIEFGGENQSGGYNLPLNVISPKTISNIWGMLDFGVFDISHARLDAIDLGITYKEYINELRNKDKVKILHVSGNVDRTGRFKNRIDKHLMMDKSDIKDIINTIKEFPNLDLAITEFSFNSKYSFEKELVIEICTLNKIVKTLDEDESIRIYDFLSDNLEEDISNVNELIHKI